MQDCYIIQATTEVLCHTSKGWFSTTCTRIFNMFLTTLSRFSKWRSCRLTSPYWAIVLQWNCASRENTQSFPRFAKNQILYIWTPHNNWSVPIWKIDYLAQIKQQSFGIGYITTNVLFCAIFYPTKQAVIRAIYLVIVHLFLTNWRQFNFSCVCPVIDSELRHNIVKVVWIHSATALWIHSYFGDGMTKFMVNNRTDNIPTIENFKPFLQQYKKEIEPFFL